MYIRRNIKWSIILSFAWKYLLFYAFWSAVAVLSYFFFKEKDIQLVVPFLPLSTIGIAVALYIGFKNSQSYDRFWEARKIWGGIVNYSRTWANQVLSFITLQHSKKDISNTELQSIHKRLVYRHLAWVNALRLKLRQPSTFSIKHVGAVRFFRKGTTECTHWEGEVLPFLSQEEYDKLAAKENFPAQLIRMQGEELKNHMTDTGLIEDFRHMEMMRVLEELYILQGKCERIKNTPFPRQYAYFSKIFTWIFILLLPFGLIGEFSSFGNYFIWLTIPFHVLISWVFMTMEIVGDNSEDPFENFINDVPMSALCRSIEIDLREMLDETDLPPKVQPHCDVLM